MTMHPLSGTKTTRLTQEVSAPLLGRDLGNSEMDKKLHGTAASANVPSCPDDGIPERSCSATILQMQIWRRAKFLRKSCVVVVAKGRSVTAR